MLLSAASRSLFAKAFMSDLNQEPTPPPEPPPLPAAEPAPITAATPPPLPPRPPPPPPSTSGAWTSVATAAILAPVLVFGLAMLLQPLRNASPEHARYLTLAYEILAGLFLLAGLGCSVAALAGAFTGRKGLAVRAVIGLVVNGLLIGLFVTNFTRARRAALARQETSQKAQALHADMIAKARQGFDPERGITNPEAFKIDRMQKLYADSAKAQSGDQAKMNQAAAAFFGRLAGLQKDLERVFPQLQETDFADFSALNTPNAFRQRKALLNQFIQVNDRLASFMTNAPNLFAEEMRRQKASPQFVEQSVRGFSSGFVKPVQLRTIVGACRARSNYGQATLVVYDFLEKNRGNWTYDRDKNEIKFTPDTLEAEYEPLVTEWDETQEKMSAAETALVEMQRRMLSGK